MSSLPLSCRSHDGPLRRIHSGLRRALCIVGAMLSVLAGLPAHAQGYTPWITTNPWLDAFGRLTPSRCDGAGVDSQFIRFQPGADRGYDFPERMRDQLLALANGACVGKGNGIGACQELSNWRSTGACVVTGGGTTSGSVACPYAVTMKTWESVGDSCGALQQSADLTDYLLSTGKHCQAIDSYGQFDAVARRCNCSGNRLFVPEEGRCVESQDVLWTPHCDTCYGNPIYPSTGAKQQRFTLGWQPWYGLLATFNSIRKIPYDPSLEKRAVRDVPTTLSGAWVFSLDKMVIPSDPANLRERLSIARGDGFTTAFAWTGNGFTPFQAQSTESIQEKAFGGWLYRSAATGVMEVYGSDGILNAQVHMSGKSLTIVRSDANTAPAIAPQPGLPIQLTDQDGRAVNLQFMRPTPDAGPVLSQVIDPAGRITSLKYTDGLPSEIVNSDSTSVKLLSQSGSDPATSGLLIGYENENGVRAGTYAYDSKGRAISTARANGLDAYSVEWTGTAPIWTWKDEYDRRTDRVLHVHRLQPGGGARVMYPNGTTELIDATSTLDAVQWSRKTRPATPGSPAATTSRQFDERGNVRQLDDYNGNRSCMSYEADRNLESTRVEGLSAATDCASTVSGTLPAGARKVSTQWHPVWRLATRIAEPGRITTLVYNGQPDPFNGNAQARCEASGATLPDGSALVLLCKRVEQATADATGEQGFSAVPLSTVAARAWSWTYTSTGQVLTETNPRGKTTVTNEYYAATTADYTKGDLKTTVNALGQTTSFPRYNAYGQPLEMIDANAVSTVYAYDERQRLKSMTTLGGVTTYAYWPTGDLKQTVMPDTSAVNYEYDDARRLTAVADSLGNRIEYTLDQSGNRTQEVAKDPQGTLQRAMNRVYDALGRAQQATGRE